MPEEKGYVKLWLSYEDYFEPLGDAEVGRLARAMIQYKSSGAAPKFSGNERFVWPAIKRDIDAANAVQESYHEKQSQNGRKGGRPPRNPKNPPLSDDNPKNPPLSDDNPKNPPLSDDNPKNPPLFSETQKRHGQGNKDKGQGQGEGQGKEKEKENPSPGGEGEKKETPPTLPDIVAFCHEQGYTFDPVRFHDYYAERGFPSDWQARAAKWQATEFRNKARVITAAESAAAPAKKVDMEYFRQLLDEI